jgi:two-component system, NarL family, sensor kinase
VGISLDQTVQEASRVAPSVAKRLEEIQSMVQQLSREIRTTSYLLHPPLLDESGLSSALNWYVQGFGERSGIAVSLEVAENLGRLPSDVELAIFRLVQECLTNIHRHSQSNTAFVRAEIAAQSIQIEVSDKGKGISPERLTEIQSGRSGVGIRGMQERLRQFGGEITVESNPSGTRVLARIPIPRETTPAQMQRLQAAL